MSISQQHHARDCLVEGLRRQLDRWAADRPTEETVTFSTGAAALDRLLPGGGLRPGMLVEWVDEGGVRNAECGMPCSIRNPQSAIRNSSVTLSLVAAREACRPGGVLVVIDRRQMFYPPAAAAWGIDLGRLLVVHPRDRRDELWAMVQSLRSPAVAAVWAMVDRLDQRASRRLQLATQAGRALGLVLRPPDARNQPSWADVRLGVSTEQRAEGRGPEKGGGGRRIENLQFAICNLQSPRFPPVTTPPPPSAPHPPPSSGSRPSTLDSRLIRVRVLRTRRGRAGAAALLEIDDTAHLLREASPNDDANSLPVVAQLADPAAPSRPARAQ